MKRIHSIDIVRGIVMIIMALDHTRDLVHVTSVSDSPSNLQTTTTALFFTRWITHFCAPTFVFISGVSAYLGFKKTNNLKTTRNFLLTRGVWLVVLEFTLVNFGIWFNPHFNVFIFDVIATIGFGFMMLSLFLKASSKTILFTGLFIIFLHNLSSFILATGASLSERIARMMILPGAIPIGKEGLFIMGYPPLPWLGIMLIGFAAGKLFELPASIRKQMFLQIGLACWALFIIVRTINVYGDPFPWSIQNSNWLTLLSFLNVTKYPPSLDFVLLTVGGMCLLVSWVEGLQNKLTDFASVYGHVPLFYFIIHWYILHPLMFGIVFCQGYRYADLDFGVRLGRPKERSGVNLLYTYLIWVSVIIALYPICKWYGQYKQKHKEIKWLRYL